MRMNTILILNTINYNNVVYISTCLLQYLYHWGNCYDHHEITLYHPYCKCKVILLPLLLAYLNCDDVVNPWHSGKVTFELFDRSPGGWEEIHQLVIKLGLLQRRMQSE